MDILSLKKYQKKATEPYNLTISKQNHAIKNDGLTTDNHSHNKSIKTSDLKFIEFYVNDTPLSLILDQFYNNQRSILFNSIGVLGGTLNKAAEIIKIKQLLGKNVSEVDIRRVYPRTWTSEEFEYYLEKYQDELTDPEILIYCCAACGDYDCGGVTVSINNSDRYVNWELAKNKETLIFQFDKYQYYDVLNNRLGYLEKSY